MNAPNKSSNALSACESSGLVKGNGVSCAIAQISRFLTSDVPCTRNGFENLKPYRLLGCGWAADMLWTRAKADKPGRKFAQNWKPFQQTKHKWKGSLFLIGASASDDSTMNKYLHSLNEAGWAFAARLHCSQIVNLHRTALELFRARVCGRDRVLNSEVDSDTAGR